MLPNSAQGLGLGLQNTDLQYLHANFTVVLYRYSLEYTSWFSTPVENTK